MATKHEKRTKKHSAVHSATAETIATGEDHDIPSGSGPGAGTGHGAAAPAVQPGANGDPNLGVGQHHNMDYKQGGKVPAQIPFPFTVPVHPWQLPPGSAIPV